MVIHVRPVGRADAARLGVLLGPLGHPAELPELHERLDMWLGEPASSLLGADDDGVLVGAVALHVCPLLERTGRLGRVLALAVDDRYAGQGLGRCLLEAAEAAAREAGCVLMEVASSRRHASTQQLYRELGYEDTSGTKARFTKDLNG